jgi:hypothetical protein
MRILMLATMLAGSLCAPLLAQTDNRPTGEQPQPSRPSAVDKDRGKSGSSVNTPTTGETTGRNNPSISTAPDNAPARGSSRPQ